MPIFFSSLIRWTKCDRKYLSVPKIIICTISSKLPYPHQNINRTRTRNCQHEKEIPCCKKNTMKCKCSREKNRLKKNKIPICTIKPTWKKVRPYHQWLCKFVVSQVKWNSNICSFGKIMSVVLFLGLFFNAMKLFWWDWRVLLVK